MKKTTSCKKHPCPIHRNWVDSSKTLDDSTRFARYVSTWFVQSSRLANRLLAWWIDNRGNDSCRFDWIESNRQHFQPTLQSTGSQNLWNKDTWTFLVLKTWPQNLVDSYHSCRIDNIFNPPYIVHASRLPACRIHSRGNDSCRFDRIESNRQHFRPTLKAQIS